jgi:hypothetical protein
MTTARLVVRWGCVTEVAGVAARYKYMRSAKKQNQMFFFYSAAFKAVYELRRLGFAVAGKADTCGVVAMFVEFGSDVSMIWHYYSSKAAIAY